MRRMLAAVVIVAIAAGTIVVPSMARDDEAANAAFGGFRSALVADLIETRARLAEASAWVDDPDWHLVRTPDSGTVGIRLSQLDDHAALLADPAFAGRVDVLADPVHAWDEEFTLALLLIGDLVASTDADPAAAAARLVSEYGQTADEKRAMLRPERLAMRADRDQLIAAIDEYDELLAGMGREPAPVAAADIRPPSAQRPEGPLELVLGFRDELVADRVALQARMAACRTAIDERDVVAFGEQETFKFRDQLRFSDVVAFDLPTLPDYADFPAHLRDDPEAWDRFDTVFAPDTARRSALLGALLLFSFWQDWPPDMRASAERMWPLERRTAQEDRRRCRPLLELLRPERDRLDVAIAALDEYLTLTTLDAVIEPAPQPVETPVDDAEPERTPAPDPFADL